MRRSDLKLFEWMFMQIYHQPALAGDEKIHVDCPRILVEQLEVEYRLTANQDVANTTTFLVLTNLSLQIC